MKKEIQEVITVLDKYLGDTDPHITDDMNDSDIKQQEPIFWCCQKLSLVLKENDNPKPPEGLYESELSNL